MLRSKGSSSSQIGTDSRKGQAIGSLGRGPTMGGFNYNTEAELFPGRKSRCRPVGYRRFARAADAIRFTIEELPPELLLGTCLEVDEERYDSDAIRR
jgi:hypothetical protein